MAKSVFRRFPSDDLESELPEWNAVNLDGQVFVKLGVNSAAHEIAEDFWEAGAAPIPTRGRISYVVAETPLVQTRGRVSVAEFEIPLAPTRGRISVVSFEVVFLATRGRFSLAELESPFLGTRGRISMGYAETPFTATRGRYSQADLEVPSYAAPTRGLMSNAYFETPRKPVYKETTCAPGRGTVGRLMRR